jgi:hypothetical protein
MKRAQLTADARWHGSSKAIVSVLALSGALSEVLSSDVIIDTTQETETQTRVVARTADDCEELEIWLIDYGSFCEAEIALSLEQPRFRGIKEQRRRLESFCALVEAALTAAG